MSASSPRSVQQLLYVPQSLSASLPPTYSTPKPAPVTAPASPTSVHAPSAPTEHPQSHAPWLAALLSTKFYGPCPHHQAMRKNDQNLFCTTHAVKICQYCHRADHCHHHNAATHGDTQSCHRSSKPCTVLHVSRYMYHDVLLAREAAPLLPLTHVQSYLNNGNRVVYIDRRAQPRSKLPPHARSCVVCERTLQDPYRFCSVFCSLVFANDPAAHPELPIPDATPLPHLPMRRPTRSNKPADPSPSHRIAAAAVVTASVAATAIAPHRISTMSHTNPNPRSPHMLAHYPPPPLPPPSPPPRSAATNRASTHNATHVRVAVATGTPLPRARTQQQQQRIASTSHEVRASVPARTQAPRRGPTKRAAREHDDDDEDKNASDKRQSKRARMLAGSTRAQYTVSRLSSIPSSDGRGVRYDDDDAKITMTGYDVAAPVIDAPKRGRRKSKPRPSVVPVADGVVMTRILFPYSAHT